MRKSTLIPVTTEPPMFKVGDRVRFEYESYITYRARRGKVIKVMLAGKKVDPRLINQYDHAYIVETERRMPNSDSIFVERHRVKEYHILGKIG